MYWQEDPQPSSTPVPDDVVDVVYAIRCTRLPVDHAQALSDAILERLPWFATETYAALHTIHVAESGNGWVRPEDFIHLSRRTRLTLRLPKERVTDAQQLIGKTLSIEGNALIIGDTTLRPLSTITTIFARYVATDAADEQKFMADALQRLRELNIRPKKMLCGMENNVRTRAGDLSTRSLMLAELTPDESLNLQRHGLGSHRHLGCGVFIPHKDIQELK